VPDQFIGAGCRIRTYEGISQQIYSLPCLTASLTLHYGATCRISRGFATLLPAVLDKTKCILSWSPFLVRRTFGSHQTIAKHCNKLPACLNILEPPVGFEPTTLCLQNRCSNQLS
jgi:hypothetical protein